ncbi:MAG: hypothetical protein A2049_08835 [Elusimicrobia bacterium GWA2_62_23]|nr:MAG: hypothetical protein A2049_08835 [Elusimicrobia bacterium GWA2_62_23]OGR69748.1 MAG: hypothetical protein A2179_03895 [Elusimicrobia bacterium GWC2_63_65]
MTNYLRRILCVLLLAAQAAPTGAAIDQLQATAHALEQNRAPAPGAPAEVKYYRIDRDSDNTTYDYSEEAKLAADAKVVEAQLKAAGYTIVSSKALKKAFGSGYFDYTLEQFIEYSPPAGRAASDIQYYSLDRKADNSPYSWSEDDKLKNDSAAIQAQLKSAGYIIITSRLIRLYFGQGYYDYTLKHYIEYLPPAGFRAETVKYYTAERSYENTPYSWSDDYKLKADAAQVEAGLKNAGYVIIRSKFLNISYGPGYYDYNLRYYVEYLPPVGFTAQEIKYYRLDRDSQNTPYSWSEESGIKTDGKSMEDRLKAAGNIILKTMAWKDAFGQGYYDYNYVYFIQYTTPLNGSTAEILDYSLWTGRDGNPYLGWYGKNQAEADGKALEANFRAAGYVVLEAKVIQAYGEDRWGYYIRYVRPVQR